MDTKISDMRTVVEKTEEFFRVFQELEGSDVSTLLETWNNFVSQNWQNIESDFHKGILIGYFNALLRIKTDRYLLYK